MRDWSISYKERQRKFRPQGRVLRGWARFCMVVPSNETRGNRQKLMNGSPIWTQTPLLCVWCELEQVTQRGSGNPSRGDIQGPSGCNRAHVLQEDPSWAGMRWAHWECLPTFTIQWFCDTVCSAQDLWEAQIWYYCFMTSNLIDSKGQLKYDNLIIVYSVNNSKVI